MENRDFLTERQAAEYSGFSIHTLRQWRQRKTGFPWKKLRSGSIRYSKSKIDKYMVDSMELDNDHDTQTTSSQLD
jgi:predicted DNA-binding transcriptional regulator AlpA